MAKRKGRRKRNKKHVVERKRPPSPTFEEKDCGPENLPPDVQGRLRFDVGDQVLCKVDNRFIEARITCVGCFEGDGSDALPYQAQQLDSKQRIMVPQDQDAIIRANNRLSVLQLGDEYPINKEEEKHWTYSLLDAHFTRGFVDVHGYKMFWSAAAGGQDYMEERDVPNMEAAYAWIDSITQDDIESYSGMAAAQWLVNRRDVNPGGFIAWAYDNHWRSPGTSYLNDGSSQKTSNRELLNVILFLHIIQSHSGKLFWKRKWSGVFYNHELRDARTGTVTRIHMLPDIVDQDDVEAVRLLFAACTHRSFLVLHIEKDYNHAMEHARRRNNAAMVLLLEEYRSRVMRYKLGVAGEPAKVASILSEHFSTAESASMLLEDDWNPTGEYVRASMVLRALLRLPEEEYKRQIEFVLKTADMNSMSDAAVSDYLQMLIRGRGAYLLIPESSMIEVEFGETKLFESWDGLIDIVAAVKKMNARDFDEMTAKTHISQQDGIFIRDNFSLKSTKDPLQIELKALNERKKIQMRAHTLILLKKHEVCRRLGTPELLEIVVCGNGIHGTEPVYEIIEQKDNDSKLKEKIDIFTDLACVRVILSVDVVRTAVDAWSIDLHEAVDTVNQKARAELTRLLKSANADGKGAKDPRKALIYRLKLMDYLRKTRKDRCGFQPNKNATLGDLMLHTAVKCDNVAMIRWLVQEIDVDPFKQWGGQSNFTLAFDRRCRWAIKFFLALKRRELSQGQIEKCLCVLLEACKRKTVDGIPHSIRSIDSAAVRYVFDNLDPSSKRSWALKHWEKIRDSNIDQFIWFIQDTYVVGSQFSKFRSCFRSLGIEELKSRFEKLVCLAFEYEPLHKVGDKMVIAVRKDSFALLVLELWIRAMQWDDLGRAMYQWLRTDVFSWENARRMVFDIVWKLPGHHGDVHLQSLAKDPRMKALLGEEEDFYLSLQNFTKLKKKIQRDFEVAMTSRTGFSVRRIDGIVSKGRHLLEECTALKSTERKLGLQRTPGRGKIDPGFWLHRQEFGWNISFRSQFDRFNQLNGPMAVAKLGKKFGSKFKSQAFRTEHHTAHQTFVEVWTHIFKDTLAHRKPSKEMIEYLFKGLGFEKTPVSRLLRLFALGSANFHVIKIMGKLGSQGMGGLQQDESAILDVLFCLERAIDTLRKLDENRGYSWHSLPDLMENSLGRVRKYVTRKSKGHPDPFNMKALRALCHNPTTKLDVHLKGDKGGRLLRQFLKKITIWDGNMSKMSNPIIEHENIIKIITFFERCGARVSQSWEEWKSLLNISLESETSTFFRYILLERGIGTLERSDIANRMWLEGSESKKFSKIIDELEARHNIANAVANGCSIESFDKLANSAPTSEIVHARNRKQQGLIEIAIITSQSKLLSHLVMHYGLNPEGKGRYGKSYKQVASEQGIEGTYDTLVKEFRVRHKAAIVIQRIFRGYLARKKHVPQVSKRIQQRKAFLPTMGPLVQFVEQRELQGGRLAVRALSWTEIARNLVIGRDDDHHVDTELFKIFKERKDVSDKVTASEEIRPAHRPDDMKGTNLLVTKRNSRIIGTSQDSDRKVSTNRQKQRPLKTNPIPDTKQKLDNVRRPCVRNVLLSRSSLRMIRRFGGRYWTMFWNRVVRLSSGDRSYAMSKALKHTKRTIFETKLDSGMRILWTEIGRTITIRYICKHDDVPHYLSLIDRSYERTRQLAQETISPQDIKLDGAQISDPSSSKIPLAMEHDAEEVVLNPEGNMPVRFYEVEAAEVAAMAYTDADFAFDWKPRLHLTESEKRIVSKRKGMVMIRGRSGTGKTFCIVSRMQRDFELHLQREEKIGGRETNNLPPLRQLFVAGTERLVSNVKEMQNNLGFHDDQKVQASYQTMAKVLEDLEMFEGLMQPDETRFIVKYAFFRDKMWPLLTNSAKIMKGSGRLEKDNVKAKTKMLHNLQPLTVWTEIRSVVKGSHRICRMLTASGDGKARPLSRKEYINIGKRESPLTKDQRAYVYDQYKRYEAMKEKEQAMDDGDRTLRLLNALSAKATAVHRYDKVYVDEVQDNTQTELAILLLVSGRDPSSLFLAGDTAQSIAKGVTYRFSETRAMVSSIGGNKTKAEKPVELVLNFRTHFGILDIANEVIDRLHIAFPGAVDKSPPDRGLARGPRPALCDPKTVASLGFEAILTFNERQRVLVLDHHLESPLAKKAERLNHFVYGIRAAKGLEFSHMMLLNFFSKLPAAHQNAWKWLANPDAQTRPASIPIEVMLELKLLYTAITRCCVRLTIVETVPSKAGQAWFRLLLDGREGRERKTSTKAGLACRFVPPDPAESKKMSADEWISEGAELAAQAFEHEDASRYFHQAAVCFRKVGDAAEPHANRCAALSRLCRHRDASRNDEKENQEAAKAALECLKCGHDPEEVANMLKENIMGQSAKKKQGFGFFRRLLKRIRNLKHDTNAEERLASTEFGR
mmetsp:Transcript_7774/g.14971  ORF Transcript_7774/g.14971 Transcript_7774/m.14971 type:complete len:2434 (+) Transcript_7774:1-7302(+)